MRNNIQPIETSYNGFKFRSRLEARWAVFFGALHMPYEYEKEGFDLGHAGYYLPDFYLPQSEVWIEVKPTEPSEPERLKARVLACDRDEYVDIVIGSPTPPLLSNGSRQVLHCYPGSQPPGRQGWLTLPFILPAWLGEAQVGNIESLPQAVDLAARLARSARFEHGATPEVYNAWERASAEYGGSKWDTVREEGWRLALENDLSD